MLIRVDDFMFLSHGQTDITSFHLSSNASVSWSALFMETITSVNGAHISCCRSYLQSRLHRTLAMLAIDTIRSNKIFQRLTLYSCNTLKGQPAKLRAVANTLFIFCPLKRQKGATVILIPVSKFGLQWSLTSIHYHHLSCWRAHFPIRGHFDWRFGIQAMSPRLTLK